jgi:hypothetical protein
VPAQPSLPRFVASSLRRFVASSLRRFVASSLHCICGSVGYVVFCFSCSGCQGKCVSRSGGSVVFGVSRSVGFVVFEVSRSGGQAGVKVRGSVRGFCCVRGVTIAIGSEPGDALGIVHAVGGDFWSGGGARCGVPRRSRTSSAAAAAAAAPGVCGEHVESGVQAADSRPSHTLTGHLHHFVRFQRLRRFMSCHFCFFSGIGALCRVLMSLLSDCRLFSAIVALCHVSCAATVALCHVSCAAIVALCRVVVSLTRVAAVHSSVYISSGRAQQQQRQHQLQPQ